VEGRRPETPAPTPSRLAPPASPGLEDGLAARSAELR